MSIRSSTFRKYYPEIEDHCLNGKKVSPSSNCGMFMYKIRLLYEEGLLEDKWIKVLEEINFPWVKETPFERRLKDLQKYMSEKKKYPPSATPLGAWVSKTKHLYRRGQISEEKIDKLKKINFIFND